jgi:hypothetical protein
MGVALVALAFAVSGTSLAQGAATRIGKLISGSSIKKGSIPGNRLTKGGVTADRIKSNSLTGKQINEATLAKVPSAASADKAQTAGMTTNAQRATNADNALALGGVAAAAYQTFATRTIPSGITVTGAFGISSNVAGAANDLREVVDLPGLAPADLSDETVNFANAVGPIDVDLSCTGNPNAPTAPAGKVCLYLSSTQGVDTTVEGTAIPSLLGSRSGFAVHAASLTTGSTGVFGTWAYTAP